MSEKLSLFPEMRMEMVWASVKETIGFFIEDQYRNLRQTEPKFKDQTINQELNLFYDLGHNDRGYDDFPVSITLVFPHCQPTGSDDQMGDRFEAETDFGGLLEQIVKPIQVFSVNRPGSEVVKKEMDQTKIKDLQTFIEFIKRKAKQSIKLTLVSNYGYCLVKSITALRD
jgi:hypothetical protein